MKYKFIIGILLSAYCGIICSAEYDEQALQKLFTDKQQREKIDALRSGKTIGKEVRKSDKVSVTGYVTRSDGKSVVWVNNKNTMNASKVDDVTVYQSTVGKNKKVTVRVGEKNARLKPGQTWYKDSGKIVDNQ